MTQDGPKIALVHDHLIQDGGAERTLRVLCDMFPEAPVFTLVHDPKRFTALKDTEIRTSYIQTMPFALKKYEWFLPFMPSATEHYNLHGYDVIISSTSALAKGIIPQPGSAHICYCHTPTRYLWTDTHEYIRDSKKIPGPLKKILPIFLSYLRHWDHTAAQRVDHFVANSHTVSGRISRFYQKPSTVIYPPVDTHLFSISDKPKTYFLAGGRIMAYKRFDLIIDVFNRLRLPLKVFGNGPHLEELKARAKDNIEFLGRVSDEERTELFENCMAFINPQEEDFGITPVEAMSAGRPVIGYGKGGNTETILPGTTGELFDEQTWESLAETLFTFDHTQYDPVRIREHAQQFSTDVFKQRIQSLVDEVYAHRG